MINSKTKAVFILGHPVAHSKSPVFQNAGLVEAGINAVYLALDIKPENFNAVVGGLKKLDILGLNVTIPHKTNIINFCDSLSEEAKALNAVNTVENDNGKWIGHNTDWYGVYKTLELRSIGKNHNPLLIGAGGASPGVIFGLQKYGIKDITITNRTMNKAEKLAKHFNIKIIDINNIKKEINNYSFLINSTSIHFNDIIDDFDNNTLYFDLKYYTEDVSAKNFINGQDMLLYQGIKSFSIWIKGEAPVEIMKKALFS